jgi:hypothetical protein
MIKKYFNSKKMLYNDASLCQAFTILNLSGGQVILVIPLLFSKVKFKNIAGSGALSTVTFVSLNNFVSAYTTFNNGLIDQPMCSNNYKLIKWHHFQAPYIHDGNALKSSYSFFWHSLLILTILLF